MRSFFSCKYATVSLPLLQRFALGAVSFSTSSFLCLFCVPPRFSSKVAHNCHSKTKSHGTTNSTHGKTKFTHGKTNETSWLAVFICIWNVRRVTVKVTHCSLEKPPFSELTMFCSSCESEVDKDTNFCKNFSRGTFLNLKCSYWHFF